MNVYEPVTAYVCAGADASCGYLQYTFKPCSHWRVWLLD